MADRPMTFSAPMVQALLAGRKTQTRRVLKPLPEREGDPYVRWPVFDYTATGWRRLSGVSSVSPYRAAPYTPGDRLWVREAWRPDPNGCSMRGTIGVFYAADRAQVDGLTPTILWRLPKQAQRGNVTPLHMPRWASRLTLHVSEVRVQRLQEISEEDAIREGAAPVMVKEGVSPTGMPFSEWSRRDGFRTLWNSLHGTDAWDANPWVCAIAFEVERANIDAARAG